MGEVEPSRHPKKEVAPRHIPSEIVPIPFDQARDLVRDALTGTSVTDRFANALAGWALFEPHVRFTPVDDAHTRIEFDATGSRFTETVLFNQRRAEIDRFFVAIQDELGRREQWRAMRIPGPASIEESD